MKRTTELRILIAAFGALLACLEAAAVSRGAVSLAAPRLQAQRSERAKTLGKRLMCLCGCNQILTECNHVGCSMSAEMLKKLDQQVARNEPDDLTIQAFVQEYGARALAEPPASGFSGLAWAMPLAALLVGVLIVWTVLQHMRRPRLAEAGPAPMRDLPPEALDRWRQRADQESEE